MISPFTNFELGLGPGVMVDADPEQSPEFYDYVGLVKQALRSIEVDSLRAQRMATGDCMDGNATPVIYVGEEFNQDVPVPKGYMDVAAVVDAYNELGNMAYQTSADCWWFPTPRQLETPRDKLSPDELPERDDVMTLIQRLEVDAQRFVNAGEALLSACDESQKAFDEYRVRNRQ